jgi:hypothetical protein
MVQLDALQAGRLHRAQPGRALQVAPGGAQALQRQREGDPLDVEAEAPALAELAQ